MGRGAKFLSPVPGYIFHTSQGAEMNIFLVNRTAGEQFNFSLKRA